MGKYDDAVRQLCTIEPASICRWLGAPVDPARPVRIEASLPTTTRQVDALILVGLTAALHIEFQAAGEAHFACRMLDYLLRLHRLRELDGVTIHQHVVMLGPGNIDEGLHLHGLDFRYTVHYLRDEPVDQFLAEPALAPFAPLARLPDDRRADILRRAFDMIAAVGDDHVRNVLARAAYDLAALRLPAATIDQTWKESGMPIPSLTQRIHDEAHEQGLEDAAASALRRRFGPDDRIAEVAHRLAALGPDRYFELIDNAASLDELAEPS